jgi:hypothetical protein
MSGHEKELSSARDIKLIMCPYDVAAGIEKYRNRMNNVRLKVLFRKQEARVHSKAYLAHINQAIVFGKVSQVMNKNAVNLELRPFYLAYGLGLDKSQRIYPYIVDRMREHTILRTRWETRGLNAGILGILDKLLIWNTSNPTV